MPFLFILLKIAFFDVISKSNGVVEMVKYVFIDRFIKYLFLGSRSAILLNIDLKIEPERPERFSLTYQYFI